MSNSQYSKDLKQGQDAQPATPSHSERNKRVGSAQVIQTNEPRSTPESRSDGESRVGGSIQSQARKGGR